MNYGRSVTLTYTRIDFNQRQQLQKIFNIKADPITHRLHQNDLYSLFQLVDFQPNQKQKDEYKKMFQYKKNGISFNDFLKIFSLREKDSEYSKKEVINAFRLLSKEYDNDTNISLSRIKQVLEELDLPDEEIFNLTAHLISLCDDNESLNFQEFVDGSF